MHLLRVQGFYFARCNTATYKRLQHVLCHPCSYTANATKQRAELYRRFSCDCARSSAHDTRLTQVAIIPPVPRWSACPRLDTLNQYQIPDAAPRRCTAQHSRPIIIRYIRVQRRVPVVDPCQTVQQIADHASPEGLLLSSADRWQVLTRCQQYRPDALDEGSASPPAQGQPGGGLDTSRARRLKAWHRSAVRAHRLALFTRRGSPVAGARRAARNC